MRNGIGQGSYALVFELEKPVVNRLGCFLGRYCYVGSAFGPGGVRARVVRHLRPSKPVQWHIDVLTTSPHFRPVAIYATKDRLECDLARSLSGVLEGHPGFGSSDCRCTTHLFRVGSLDHLDEIISNAGMAKLDVSLFLP